LFSCKSVQLLIANSTKNYENPKFETDIIAKGSEVFPFQEMDEKGKDYFYERKPFQGGKNLAEFIQEDEPHTAYLLIKNDTIIHEYYPDGYDKNNLRQTFSISKAMLSALVGILVEEDVLRIEDSIVNYFPELKDEKGHWKELTVEHLLNMRSGTKFLENEFKIPYYGILRLVTIRNSKKYGFKANFERAPGQKSMYNSLDAHLLGLIVEEATQKSLSDLLGERIWSKIGMESDAAWALDSKKHKNTKGYCCIEARVRDVARFGLLLVNEGKYKDQQIIPKKWFEKTFNEFNNDWCYQNYWRSKLKHPKNIYKEVKIAEPNYQKDPNGAVMDTIIAKQKSLNCGAPYFIPGLFGQYLILYPEDNIVCVRLGTSFTDKVFNNLSVIRDRLLSYRSILNSDHNDCKETIDVNQYLGLYLNNEKLEMPIYYRLLETNGSYLWYNKEVRRTGPFAILRKNKDCEIYGINFNLQEFSFSEKRIEVKTTVKRTGAESKSIYQKVECECQDEFKEGQSYEFGAQVKYKDDCYVFNHYDPNEYEIPGSDQGYWIECD
jgi:CubicO group peptidase (beta-lactamase class C family)